MRRYLALFADTHCGHKHGLLNPETTLYQTRNGEEVPYKPNPTATQKVLWKEYSKNFDKMVEWADGNEIIPIMAGDATNGNKHPAGNISDSIADQIVIARDCLMPWLELSNVEHFRLIVGTQAHSFGASSSEKLLTDILRMSGKDVKFIGHTLLDVDGVKIDTAHHGPSSGIRAWLHGNSARYYLTDRMYEEIQMGNDPPELYVRAHYHEYVKETRNIFGKKMWESNLVVLPSYCGLTEFARQVTRSVTRITFGTIGVEITDGRLTDIRPFIKTFDLRGREKL